MYRIIISNLVVLLLIQGKSMSRAQADTCTQSDVWASGCKIQGTLLQGTAHDGRWLRGAQLIGILPGAQDGQADALIEIIGFHGETVAAVRYDPSQGTRERVVLHPRALVGLEWADELCSSHGACTRVLYRVAAVAPDASRNTMPAHADNGDVWLYEIQHAVVTDPGPRDWQNVCPADAGHERLGMFVDGRWDRQGRFTPRGYTFSCAAGVIAKCARGWGYKPWKHLTVDVAHGVSLRPLHLACIRAARADYCGDGTPHTRAGTPIDLFDVHGLNLPADVPGFTAEAAFGTQNAAWVQRPRHESGVAGEGGWRFDSCQRPYPGGEDEHDAPLVYVWSGPRAGGDAPGGD